MKTFNNSGSALAGYAILAGLVSIVAIGSVSSSGEKVDDVFKNVTSNIEEYAFGRRSCDLSSGSGIQVKENGEWGDCLAVSCDAAFHIEDGSCVSDSREVPISNGTAYESWVDDVWSVDYVSCDTGYEPDGQQCSRSSGVWVFEYTYYAGSGPLPSKYHGATAFGSSPSGGECFDIGSYSYHQNGHTPPMPSGVVNPIYDYYRCD